MNQCQKINFEKMQNSKNQKQSTISKQRKVLDEYNGPLLKAQKKDCASKQIPKLNFNFESEQKKTQKYSAKNKQDVSKQNISKKFAYLRKLSQKNKTNEYRKRHQSLSQKSSFKNLKFMKENNLVESIYESETPRQKSNRNLYQEYKRGLSQFTSRFNRSNKENDDVIPNKADSLLFSQKTKEKNLSQINFQPVKYPTKMSKADIYLSNFQYKVTNQNGKSVTNFVEKENFGRSKEDNERISKISHVVKVESFENTQNLKIRKYQRQPFQNSCNKNYHKTQEEYFNFSQFNYYQLIQEYNMNIEHTIDKLLLCWISKEFNYFVVFRKNRTQIEKSIYDIIVQIKDVKTFDQIESLKEELQNRKQEILDNLKIQQNLLKNLNNFAQNLLLSLKSLKNEQKVEFLFFLSILRYIKTNGSTNFSVKYISQLFFKKMLKEEIFVTKEIEIFTQKIQRKFNIEKIYKWFLENKKILNLSENKFCQKLFEQMFRKKCDLKILQEYSCVYEENANIKFLYEMIYGQIMKKTCKNFKVQKKQLLNPFNNLLAQSCYLGQNEFFLFFLVVSQKVRKICSYYLTLQKKRLQSF